MCPEPKKIGAKTDKAKLEKDLERYRGMAIELGASDACVIAPSDIPVDERVVLKCQVPRCFGYGVSAHCPPNTLRPAELRSCLAKCSWAVFFIKEASPDIIVRDKTTIKERVAAYQDVFRIVTEVESAAFYDGHYLAFGFAAGSCRYTFCGLEEDCRALSGKKCRFSLRARPSMEAVGIDVYRMVVSAGWDIYPIGSNTRSCDVPRGVLAGIVIG